LIETLQGLAIMAGTDFMPSGGSVSLENPRNSLAQVFDLMPSFTGRSVTELNSLSVSTVWACVRIISTTVARVPTKVYRVTSAGREVATDHYLYALLCGSANPRLSSFRFFRLMQVWLLLWGNAFAEIEMNGRGQITALWPMRPDRMRVHVDESGAVTYIYQPVDGTATRAIDESRMFHLRGLETDGVAGLSVIQQARQAVGLSMATEEFGARFFANNARPGMVLETPNSLSDKAIQRLKDGWDNMHRGLQGAHRAGILEEGLKLHEVGLPPEDAQFLQTREFQTEEICRWYGVQPHKVGNLSKATNNNIEHQSLEFVGDTMDEHFCNWESEITHTLLSAREAMTISPQFDRARLLRGDFKSRAEGLAILRQNGFINGDEGREDLGYNPIEGGAGKKYAIQLNMQDLEQLGEDAEQAEPATEGKDDAKQ
jgi:HK97 family phage portal protein